MRLSWFNITALTFGFAFLYLPMVILVIFSFNESKLVTVWAGFSTKWYGELLHNEAFLDAAWVTLKVAVLSSTLATVLGTLPGTISFVLLAACSDVIGVGDGFGADEAFFKVAVDDARRLRRGPARFDGPGAGLFRTGGEIGDEAE